MPSRLLSPNPQIRAQQRQRSQVNTPIAAIRAETPWRGYEPDLAPSQASPGSMGPSSRGLVARPDPSSRGEVLMPDEGFTLLDSGGTPGTELPLGGGASGHVNSTNAILLLTMWDRTNTTGTETGEFQRTPIAVTAGTLANRGSCQFWRRSPASTDWTEMDYAGASGAGADARSNRHSYFDSCQMPSGANGRALGDIDEPAIVMCNGIQTVGITPDEVFIAPAANTVHTYEELTNVAALDPFFANSCETFNGRVFFLGTEEAGAIHRQRLRWTALFTADPLPTNVGAGAIDFREFTGDGLRCETLGNVLACYFADGVAFVRSTGVATAPVARQILTTKRGLLSRHAVTQVPDKGHFGIFTDGWFFLDPSGRWTEIGNGRWKRDFYARLDNDPRPLKRLFVHYRQPSNLIYIAFPSIDSASVNEVWIYDVAHDRVFIDIYPGTVTDDGAGQLDSGPLTVFGDIDLQIQASTIWSAVTGTWSSIIGSWASFGAQFGATALVHGGGDGRPMIHNADVITRVNQSTGATINDTWRFKSPLSNLGQPGKLKTSDRVSMEYIDVNGPNATFQVYGTPTDGSQSATVDFPTATLGDTRSIHRNIRLTGENLGFDISGATPVLIRSIGGEFFLWDVEPRV